MSRSREEADISTPTFRDGFIDFELFPEDPFAGFYKDAMLQQCPVSGSILPPGLSSMLESRDTVVGIMAATSSLLDMESNLQGHAELAEAEDQLLPSGLLDHPPMAEQQQAPPADKFSLCKALSMDTSPPGSKPPVVLDLAHALLTSPQLPAHLPSAGSAPYDPITATCSANISAAACPTVGSQAHWTGNCKPCAFLHTKGCSNGALCGFCHICDKGAKKRRAKDRRFSPSVDYC